VIDVARLAETARAVRALSGPLPIPVATPYATCAYDGPAGTLRADVYLPDAGTGASAILVHGGGFVVGSRDMKPMRILATDLVARGVAVASIEYRLAGRARLDGMVDDVVAGVQWWHGRLSGLGLDAARVALVGQSAGGALAHLALERVGGVAQLVGLMALVEPAKVRGAPQWLGRWLAPPERRSDLGIGPAIPYTLLHGDQDRILPFEHVASFTRRRLEAGLPTELHCIAGLGHGYHADPAGEPAVRIRGRVADLLARA
jgi:acetyl esterase/lipase